MIINNNHAGLRVFTPSITNSPSDLRSPGEFTEDPNADVRRTEAFGDDVGNVVETSVLHNHLLDSEEDPNVERYGVRRTVALGMHPSGATLTDRRSVGGDDAVVFGKAREARVVEASSLSAYSDICIFSLSNTSHNLIFSVNVILR